MEECWDMKLLPSLFEMYEALESLDPQSRVTVNESSSSTRLILLCFSVGRVSLKRKSPTSVLLYIFLGSIACYSHTGYLRRKYTQNNEKDTLINHLMCWTVILNHDLFKKEKWSQIANLLKLCSTNHPRVQKINVFIQNPTFSSNCENCNVFCATADI